jgi:integrase
MQTLLFEPFLILPHSIVTLSDAIALMDTERRKLSVDRASKQRLGNAFWLARSTADVVCEILGKDRASIKLEEILDLDDDLIRYALAEDIDRRHASKYATACRKMIRYARSRGWTCDAIVRIESWQPVKDALSRHNDGTQQIVRYLISAGKTPVDTTEADLYDWHKHAVANGLSTDAADMRMSRFRSKLRAPDVKSLFPLLDLESKRRSSYGTPIARMHTTIQAQIGELVLYRSKKWVEGRDARRAVSPSEIQHMLKSFRKVHGCLTGELGMEPFESLGAMATTENLCAVGDWLASKRHLLRKGVHRIIDPILAVAGTKCDMFPSLDSAVVRKHIKLVPKEPKHKLRARKEEKALPYEVLAEIPKMLQERIEAEGVSEVEAAWLKHDKAILSILLVLAFRQRNIRECTLTGSAGSNLVSNKLNPKLFHELEIPDCVREAYNNDASRKFLMFVFSESETKGKRAQTEVIPLELAQILEDYLKIRPLLVSPESDPGSLFLNRAGNALSEHNLRDLVRRLTRNYVGKTIHPHLWRDIFAANFRVQLATGMAKKYSRLWKRLWHMDEKPTEMYSQLGYALPGVAALNQQYLASQQTDRKEVSEQLAQPDLRLGRAA